MPQYFYTLIYNKLFKDAGHKVTLVNSLTHELKADDVLLVDSYIYMMNYDKLIGKCKIIVIGMEPIFIDKWKNLAVQMSKADLVLDYSVQNIEVMNKYNTKAIYVPPSYSPIYKELYGAGDASTPAKTIDILFYGTYNKRRRDIFEELAKHCNVVIKNSGSIKNQNFLIRKTKIVLIVQHSLTQDFDYARASFLITNKVLVIHEQISEKENVNNIIGNLLFFPYDKLVDETLRILKENKIDELANKQYEFFKKKCNVDSLVPDIKNIDL